MARNFHRGPPTHADVRSGLDMEAEMRRLVAEKVALSVSRGSSPRGAYGAIPKSSAVAATKTQLWGIGSATAVAVAVPAETVATDTGGGLHHHAFPRGAPRPPPAPTQDDSSSARSRSSNGKTLESVLGIYPAESKLPPGKSAADEFVATIAKRFQLGRRKSSVSSTAGGSISTARSSSAAGGDAASYRSTGAASDHLIPTSTPKVSLLAIVEPPRSAPSPRGRAVDASDRPRAQSRSKGRKGPRSLPPCPSNEGVYATMPLPAVPPSPSFLPPPQIFLNADALAEKTRQALTCGIDIAEWTESVSPCPPSATTTVSTSPPLPTPIADNRHKSRSSSSPRASSYIKRLSLHRLTPERVDSSAASAFPSRRKHCTRISVSSAGSKVAFPCAYDLSEGESTGSSSARTERTTQRPVESPPPRQPAPAPQVTDNGVCGASDDDGDDISLHRHRDSDEETLHLPDTLDEILDAIDLSELQPESGATTEVPQSDCEGEEKAYCTAGIYEYCTRASLLLQKAEAYEWKDRRRGNIFTETRKDTNPAPAPAPAPVAGPRAKTGLDAEIEAYLAERRKLLEQ